MSDHDAIDLEFAQNDARDALECLVILLSVADLGCGLNGGQLSALIGCVLERFKQAEDIQRKLKAA